MDVGFIGLGSMGRPMAANLLKAGHSLRLWNRSKDKADELIAAGARWVNSPAEVVQEGGVVVTMVADDAALHGVTDGADGFGETLGRGGVHVSMSTVSPATTAALAAYHRARGADYLAAPVFGRPEAAAAQKLFILAAGPAAAKERAQPLFTAMGQKVFDLGEEAARASVLKLSGNFMIMAAIEAMAEACTLGERYGLAREQVIEVMSQTLFPAPLYANYGRQIATHTYTPAGFRLKLGLKDANLVLNAANRMNVPMPLAQLMQARFQSGVAKSRGELDWAGVALSVAEDAGLKPGG
jgi:3-hydroxyisobutyrate dehydrogenase-like beta-hydroxyacid dehydrogenase